MGSLILASLGKHVMDQRNRNEIDLWKPCVKGSLQKIAHENRNRFSNNVEAVDRRNMLKFVAGTVAVAASVGFVATFNLSPSGPAPQTDDSNSSRKSMDMGMMIAGLSCKTCQDNIPSYATEKIEDQDMIFKMGEHIRQCDMCREVFEKTKTELS